MMLLIKISLLFSLLLPDLRKMAKNSDPGMYFVPVS